MKKKGRPTIPVPKTPEEALGIARIGEMGADTWMPYLQGNPFIEGKAMEEALQRGGGGTVTLEGLRLPQGAPKRSATRPGT